MWKISWQQKPMIRFYNGSLWLLRECVQSKWYKNKYRMCQSNCILFEHSNDMKLLVTFFRTVGFVENIQSENAATPGARKFSAALRLLARWPPKMLLMLPINMAFGTSAAFLTGYINGVQTLTNRSFWLMLAVRRCISIYFKWFQYQCLAFNNSIFCKLSLDFGFSTCAENL